MRLPILRTLILALVLTATPASLSVGFLIPPSSGYIVLAMSDVIACDPPGSTPHEAEQAYRQVGFPGEDSALLWRADIYDLTECLRMKAEAI